MKRLDQPRKLFNTITLIRVFLVLKWSADVSFYQIKITKRIKVTQSSNLRHNFVSLSRIIRKHWHTVLKHRNYFAALVFWDSEYLYGWKINWLDHTIHQSDFARVVLTNVVRHITRYSIHLISKARTQIKCTKCIIICSVNYQTVNIVYLLQCSNCDKQYVC